VKTPAIRLQAERKDSTRMMQITATEAGDRESPASSLKIPLAEAQRPLD
jgi:hypothetical protein